METVTVHGLRFQIVLDDGFFTYQKKRDPNGHRHLNYELYFSEKGKCTVLCDEKKYEFNENDLFLIPADAEHNVYELSENASIYSLRFSFSPSDSQGNTEFCYTLKAKLSEPHRLEENGIMTALLQQVRAELAHPDDFCTEKILGALLSFFAEFLRHFSDEASVPVSETPFSVIKTLASFSRTVPSCTKRTD